MNRNTFLDRREFLVSVGVAALGAAGACAPKHPPSTQSEKKRALRIAHLTDIHAQPGGRSAEGMARALRHAQNQPDRPDAIFNTGDSIMDSLKADKTWTERQWETFSNVLQAECKLPITHVIGNHDVWGWDSPDTTIQEDPLYGKNMAIQVLGLANCYYSFKRAGWRFIALDSTHLPTQASQRIHPYIGKIDDEQFQWLAKEIEKTPPETPICILSHIPILCACELFDGPNEESGDWVMPAAWMHIDARRFRQLFLQHPNVRLCLSGHAHQHEVLDYLEVRYVNSGAVSGNWWNGAYMDFPPAYVLIDLYEDGTSESTFVPY